MGRRGRKVTEFVEPQVAVPIDEKKQALKAKELADLCAEIDKRRADAADAASSARKHIRALDKRRRVLTECVRTGTEMQDAQLTLINGEKKPKPIEATGKTGNGAPVMSRVPGNVDA
jgi:hypothetical protein